jgi:hypothetical protein
MDWKTYITDLNIPKDWTCTSFCNDELPSYQIHNLHIWMDSQHLTERKNNAYNIYGLSESDPLPPRFTVFNSAFYNGDTLHETPELIATNNFNELLDFVEATGINQIDKKLNEREN